MMPIIGIFIGGIDLSSWVIHVPNFIYGGADIPIAIGDFLMTVINFVIIAFVLFSMVKVINLLQKKEAEKRAEEKKEAAPSKEEMLLTEIRDILQNKK